MCVKREAATGFALAVGTWPWLTNQGPCKDSGPIWAVSGAGEFPVAAPSFLSENRIRWQCGGGGVMVGGSAHGLPGRIVVKIHEVVLSFAHFGDRELRFRGGAESPPESDSPDSAGSISSSSAGSSAPSVRSEKPSSRSPSSSAAVFVPDALGADVPLVSDDDDEDSITMLWLVNPRYFSERDFPAPSF
ncbi:uncharacterized protein BXZ73DRAFT_74783 [Epithele typhae]|uniref:uncharacterized protein n=1 Tax=Epithele typhae TaxID=378194 RepID=UPI00200784A1|nr:uncharacterized protein BXZ73DRAFT_74783 [Epithele typhae]KAH9942541.1 hypothetical protein BXZ73DRAFT_74783 [Epithele typhae]